VEALKLVKEVLSKLSEDYVLDVVCSVWSLDNVEMHLNGGSHSAPNHPERKRRLSSAVFWPAVFVPAFLADAALKFVYYQVFWKLVEELF